MDRVSGPACGWKLDSGVSDLSFKGLEPFPCPPPQRETVADLALGLCPGAVGEQAQRGPVRPSFY